VIVAVVLLLCLGLAACGAQERSLSGACTIDARTIERALTAAPRAVRLADGTPLSDCVRNATTDAELQTAGLILTTAAEDLARRAARGDVVAALRLGYLTGAVRRGAARTAGVGAELQRRVERSGAYVAEDGGAEAGAALQKGLSAGRATG
jgi:hypothetical protein